MTTRVHATAFVDRGAALAGDVEIGAYSIVGAHVVIGAGTVVGSHVVIEGHTRIGHNNRIHAFASIGGPPQDKKYAGEPTRLDIGDNNTIREYCTINTGTVQDQACTHVGANNWIMAYVHIAHDCVIGNETILANNSQLAGHVHIGDWAFLGGMTGVHQFVKVGAHAMTAGGTTLFQDLPPFVTASGYPAEARGLNVEGLKRRGFDEARINALKRAYKSIYREGLTVAQACAAIHAQIAEAPAAADDLRALRDFIAGASRGIVR